MLREHHLRPGVEPLRRLLARVDEAGIDAVGVFDHVSFWDGTGFDGLINATALAVAHPTLPVHVGVYLLPLRHPVAVARQLSSLALLAPGRVSFGVGIGGEDRNEVAVCGVDPVTRGRRMDESMEVLTRLLRGDRVDWSGEFFELSDARIRPTPPEPIPIVVGGRSDAALHRTARVGDGWVAFAASPRRFAQATVLIDEAAHDAGRGDVDWQHSLEVWCGFGQNPGDARKLLVDEMEQLYKIPFESFERYCPTGTPAEVAATLQEFVEAGCRQFEIIGCAASDDDLVSALADVRARLSIPA